MKKINIYAAFSKLSKKVSIQTLLSLGLLASFLLPWVSGLFGYEILLRPLKNGFRFYSLFTILSILPYLIVAVSVYNIIRDLLQINKTIFLYGFILGLIESVVSVYLYGGTVSFGVYSLAIFSIWGIIKTRKSSFSFQRTGKVSIRTFFSVGLFISFCLPWADVSYGWWDGFYHTLIGFDIFETNSYDFNPIILCILSWLIPFLCAYNIFIDFTQKKLIFLNEFFIGIILSIIALFSVLNVEKTSVSKSVYLQFGLYVTVIFSVLGLFSKFFPSYKFSALQNKGTGSVQKGMLYQEANNYSEAFICFYEAAKQNDMIAHNRLGELYEKGLGVEKNINMALKWYEKAAVLGDEEAKMRMEVLIKRDESEKPDGQEN
jgi:hypothetical protein